MTIRPIKTERDYDNALAEIEALFDAQPNTPDGDQLDVLTTLVQAYEQNHYPILPPDPIETLLYYMESRGLTPRELEPYLGNATQVNNILTRRRSLTVAMIRRLHQELHIPVEALIQPYVLRRRSRAVRRSETEVYWVNRVKRILRPRRAWRFRKN